MNGTRIFGARTSVAASALMLGLAILSQTGCGAVHEGTRGMERLASPTPEYTVDRGLALMARGQYGRAEQEFESALAANAYDPFALYAMATLYQNTGRNQQAVELYQKLLSIEPKGTISVGPWGKMESKSLSEAARENLRLLGGADTSPVSSVPKASAKLSTTGTKPVAVKARVADASMPAGTDNITRRFLILQRLYDEGLVTADEYGRRRTNNLGALLPYSVLPPAAGLDAPAPQADQVIDRLRQLRQSFEDRSISEQQLTDERNVVLDALLPESPRVRAAAVGKPAKADVSAIQRRIEKLREQGLISEAEADRELAAIGRAKKPTKTSSELKVTPAPATAQPSPASSPSPALGTATNPAAVLRSGRDPVSVVPDPADFQNPDAEAMRGTTSVPTSAPVPVAPAAAPSSSATSATPATAGSSLAGSGATVAATPAAPVVAPAQNGGAGGRVAVHLASFKSEEKALEGWRLLQAKHAPLQGLQPHITALTLPEKGTFYRLNAGPLPSREKAVELCKALPGLYCEPVFLGG